MSDEICGFSFNFCIAIHSSPNYPGNYPINMECNYIFNAADEQTVVLNFFYFDVEGVFPCDSDEHGSDSVEFSNYESRDRKHKFYCGKVIKR